MKAKVDLEPAWKKKWLQTMENNPIHKKWYYRLRAAKKEALEFKRKVEQVRTDEFITMLMANNYMCGYCQEKKACIVGFKVRPCDGGDFKFDNLIPVCWDCWQATKS